MIKVENISFSYHNKPILQEVSLEIKKGAIISLLGPNGAGKSTLIKVLLNLLNPSRGNILLENKKIDLYPTKELAKKIAYVPQSSSLPFSYTALEVVLMGRISYQSIFSKYSKEDIKIAKEALDTLGILELQEKIYNELSGGQKQLVLIARALSQQANIFILDEPVSGLDYGNQLRLLKIIKKLSLKGYTFLKSTHYPEHAFLVSDEVILMKEGKIVGKGSAQKTITKESIKFLYDVDVDIEKTKEGYHICIPSFKEGER